MPGQLQQDLDTPALAVDLEAMEQNILAMASLLKARDKQWRPHVKCHKVPEIARLQIAAGAIGVTAAKVSEAEVFIQAGIPDVLIAHLVVGTAKLKRLANLCRTGRPIVCCDHFAQAEALSEVCRTEQVTCRVLMEINVGLNRVGIRPGSDARDLARGIVRLPHLELAGIMGYEGHLLTLPDEAEKRSRIFRACDVLEEVRQMLLEDGISCDIVSAGGTGSYQITSEHPVITELQAGGGIFGDPFYSEKCGVTGLQPALKIFATVVGRPKLERAVLDCGRKTVHSDLFPPQVIATAAGRPLLDARIEQINSEHTVLELGPDSRDLVIGDRVELRPGYADFTTVLHDRLYGVRNGMVETDWLIAARGKLQ